jgi:membrane protein required for colicin V production
MPISIFDIAAGIILIFSIVQGIRNGFVIELASTVGFILGILGAILIGGWVEQFLSHWIDWRFLGIACYFLVFVGVVYATHYLSIYITQFMKVTAINVINRIIGGLFSLFKYAFLISIAIMVLNYFADDNQFLPAKEIQTSKLYEPLQQLAPAIFPWIDFSKFAGLIKQ